MLTALQRRFLYFPAREFVAGPRDHGFTEYEDVELKTEDGLRLHAWWLPAPAARTTVLFLHGNAGNLSYWGGAAMPFYRLGWNTLLLDYRGYGRSEGVPTEEGTYLDARAAWLHLTAGRGIDPSRLIVIGRSLGGGIATWLVEHHPAAGLVLEATFTSIADVVAGAIRLPGIRGFVRLGYPSLSRIAGLGVPLMVIHARGDELVPFAHGRTLFEAAREPKRFVELRGGHNDAFDIDSTRYVEALRGFGESVFPEATP